MLGGIGGRRRRGRQRMRWLDGITDSMDVEFEWTLGVGDGQGGLACCDSWGRKDSDMTEQLNWTELRSRIYALNPCFLVPFWRNIRSLAIEIQWHLDSRNLPYSENSNFSKVTAGQALVVPVIKKHDVPSQSFSDSNKIEVPWLAELKGSAICLRCVFFFFLFNFILHQF